MIQNVLSGIELEVATKYYGLPDTVATREMLAAEIDAVRKQRDIETYRHKSKVLYITKEKIDGEELLILSGKDDIREEFVSLNDLMQWVITSPFYKHISVLLRCDIEDVTLEELRSSAYYSDVWKLDDDELYYELLIYPN